MNYIGLFSVLVALVTSAPAQAHTPLSPARYIAIEKHVRSLTNEGMRSRLLLLGLQAGANSHEQYALDQGVSDDIQVVYQQGGTSAGRHTAYGGREPQAIAAYLARHPQDVQALQALQAEFERLSAAIDAARAE